MAAGRRLLVLTALFLAMSLRACICVDIPCPAQAWCEGTVKAKCDYECSGHGSGKIDLPAVCGQVNYRTDCKDEAAISGVAQTCRAVAESVACIDDPPRPCDHTTFRDQCVGERHIERCVASDDEGFIHTDSCDEQHICVPGKFDFPTCMDFPLVPCEPDLNTRCADEQHLWKCVEAATGEGYQVTWPCSTGERCTANEGGTVAECH